MPANLADLFQQILTGQPSPELNQQFPFYGLDAPGMPVPGPNFEALAVALEQQAGNRAPAFMVEGKGDTKRVVTYGPMIHYLYRRALYDSNFHLAISVKGRPVSTAFVPGHLLGDDTYDFNGGPRQADVMLIGKHPGQEELSQRKNFVGPTSEDLYAALNTLGIPETEWSQWYVTNLVKWPQLDRQSDNLPTAWIKDAMVLLQQELRLVRPKYILCLGSHAAKALLGTYASVSQMTGRVETLAIPIHERGEEPRYHEAKVMVANHPAFVYRQPDAFDAFKDQIGMFVQLAHGADVGGAERDIDHRVIYKSRELAKLVDEIRADPSRWFIAVDGEWHGENHTEPGAYLRTVQFSTRHGEGITVVLRHQGGESAFRPSIQHGIDQLKRLLKRDPDAGYMPRIGGHFLRADIPWLLSMGLDLRDEYTIPPDVSQANTAGWDTSLMYHATNESTSYKLEDIATRLTTCPRYDKKLQKWKEAYCKIHGLGAKDLEGYGMCPEWILHPYACYDPDATRRIGVKCEQELLNHDWFGQNSWLPYWIAHRASPAFLEMEMNGIMLDRERVDEMSQLYVFVRDKLLQHLRERIRWPDYNPESSKQCAAVLFGDRYAYRLDKATGERIPIRPPEALTLNLRPIKTTGKRSKLWDQVEARNEADNYMPSTDKEVLGIIGHEHPLAMALRDLKFVSQSLKYVLRPAEINAETMEAEKDEDGNTVYSRGLASMVHADGAIRTHMSQNKETGRASSFRPPLQNLSKRREDDYGRILGKLVKDKVTKKLAPKGDYLDMFGGEVLYKHPIRSVLRARPGHVLVEADYTGAELAVIAWLANDPVMIEHVRRNSLPEDHPDYFDIHSQTAVRVFNLNCPPTKKGLADAGMKGMRVAAKNVNFGIPYGRMAPAISRQCREEGVEISVADTERIIEFYFNTYRGTVEFLRNCGQRVLSPQWLCTAFGRRRRFVKSNDRQVVGEQQRQAQNFPIQGTVADAVSRALDNLYYYRWETNTWYRILLQIHDAILFEVPIPNLRPFIEDVLPTCMINRVPIWPTYLDGTHMESITEPYRFAIDKDIQINWGEDVTKEQAAELGIPSDLIKH